MVFKRATEIAHKPQLADHRLAGTSLCRKPGGELVEIIGQRTAAQPLLAGCSVGEKYSIDIGLLRRAGDTASRRGPPDYSGNLTLMNRTTC